MQATICLLIGLTIGGAVGTAAMCLMQVTQCSDCPYRKNRVNRDGK